MLEGLCTHAAYSDFILICVNMLRLCCALTPEHLNASAYSTKVDFQNKSDPLQSPRNQLQGAEIFISTFSCKNIHLVRFKAKLVCKRKYHILPQTVKKNMLQVKIVDIPQYSFAQLDLKKKKK